MNEIIVFAKVIVTKAMESYNNRFGSDFKREAIVEMRKDLEELKKAYAVVTVEPLNVEEIIEEVTNSLKH